MVFGDAWHTLITIGSRVADAPLKSNDAAAVSRRVDLPMVPAWPVGRKNKRTEATVECPNGFGNGKESSKQKKRLELDLSIRKTRQDMDGNEDEEISELSRVMVVVGGGGGK